MQFGAILTFAFMIFISLWS